MRASSFSLPSTRNTSLGLHGAKNGDKYNPQERCLVPEEVTSGTYFINIISLLSHSKLMGKLRHRAIKDSYKVNKRQDKIRPFWFNPRSHQTTLPHKRDGELWLPSIRVLSARSSHTLEAGTVLAYDRNEKTEPREAQGPACSHTARKRQRWDLNPGQPAQPSRDLSSVWRMGGLLAKGKASWGASSCKVLIS